MGQVINFQQQKQYLETVKAVVFNNLLQMYKDIDESTDGIKIPYFIEARNHFNRYTIKNLKDLYKEILSRNDIKN